MKVSHKVALLASAIVVLTFAIFLLDAVSHGA